MPGRANETADTSFVDGALCSLADEAPWTIVWGVLPAGVEVADVRVVFGNGRKSQPAARIGVLGRHWAAEVAGRFDKAVVSCADGRKLTCRVKPREKTKTPETRRSARRNAAAGTVAAADPLEEMKRHWGLAALVLQPGSAELSELPDLRIAGRQP